MPNNATAIEKKRNTLADCKRVPRYGPEHHSLAYNQESLYYMKKMAGALTPLLPGQE